MFQLLREILTTQFIVTAIVSVGVFVTLLFLLLPVLKSDRLGQRMSLVAAERRRLRAQQQLELARSDTNKEEVAGGALRYSVGEALRNIVERYKPSQSYE